MKISFDEVALHETIYMPASRYIREIGIRLLHGAGFALEWWMTRSDGVVFRHITGISSEAELIEFSALDPYAKWFRRDYDVILKKYAAAKILTRDEGESGGITQAGDLVRLIERVSVCTRIGDLIDSVRKIALFVGCDQFVYQWICFDARSETPGDAVETHYLSSRPVGLQEYIDRAWYMNDPYVQYACEGVRPVLTPAKRDQSDHWVVTGGIRHGFGRGLVMPCHRFKGDGTRLVGLLHLCNADALSRTNDECKLWKNRSLIRVLCHELMEWRVERIRQLALMQFCLTDEDVRVLRIIKKGGNAKIVATELGVALNAVNKSIYRQIKLKMGAKTISEAVEKAASMGLLINMKTCFGESGIDMSSA